MGEEAKRTDWYQEIEDTAQVKQKVAVARLGPSANHLQVDHPESSESDHEDDTPLEQAPPWPVLPEIATAQHPTKLIMDMGPFKFGLSEEEMPLPQMAGEDTEETKAITGVGDLGGLVWVEG